MLVLVTIANAEAYIMLPRRGRFAGCEIDKKGYMPSSLSGVQAFRKQILNED